VPGIEGRAWHADLAEDRVEESKIALVFVEIATDRDEGCWDLWHPTRSI